MLTHAKIAQAKGQAPVKCCRGFSFGGPVCEGAECMWPCTMPLLPGARGELAERQEPESSPATFTNRMSPAAMVASDNGPAWASYHVNTGQSTRSLIPSHPINEACPPSREDAQELANVPTGVTRSPVRDIRPCRSHKRHDHTKRRRHPEHRIYRTRRSQNCLSRRTVG